MAWSSIGTVTQFVANIVVLVILARLLPPSEFGLIAAAIPREYLQTAFTYALVASVTCTVVAVASADAVGELFRMGISQIF